MATEIHTSHTNANSWNLDIEAVSHPPAAHFRDQIAPSQTTDHGFALSEILPSINSHRSPQPFWHWAWTLYQHKQKLTEYLGLIFAWTINLSDDSRPAWVPSILWLIYFEHPAKRLENAGQTLFICIDRGHGNQFAIQVPCLRPTAHRRLKWTTEEVSEDGGKTIEYERYEIEPTERACESDDQIVRRIGQKLEAVLGPWTKYVPYFGVVAAEIVEFRFRSPHLQRDHLSIKIKESQAGTSITEELLRKYERAIQLSDDMSADEDGYGTCARPFHVERCLKSKDPLLGCTTVRPGAYGDGHRTCRGRDHVGICPRSNDPLLKCMVGETVCKQVDDHRPDCNGASDCFEESRRQAELLGLPGIEAFNCLPQFLRRPKDVTGLPLSKWLKKENIMCDLQYGIEKAERNPYLNGDSFRGIKVTLGWDWRRMKEHAPSHFALALIAGGLVWIAIIVWSTETDDSNTAMAFGSVLVGVFTLLLSNAHGLTSR